MSTNGEIVNISNPETKTAYQKAREVSLKCKEALTNLTNIGFISSPLIALGGSSVMGVEPSDVDLLVVIDKFEKKDDKVEELKGLERHIYFGIRAAYEFGLLPWFIPVNIDLPEEERKTAADSFPIKVDLDLYTREEFEGELKMSIEECRARGLENIHNLSIDGYVTVVRKKIAELYEKLDHCGDYPDVTIEANPNIVNARKLMDEILALPSMDKSTSKQLRVGFRNFVTGSNFAKTFIQNGAILLQGDNPLNEGNKVFELEDKEFLKQ